MHGWCWHSALSEREVRELLHDLEEKILEALCEVHQRVDRVQHLCRQLSVCLSLLESRIAFLERLKFSETTDIDLETLD